MDVKTGKILLVGLLLTSDLLAEQFSIGSFSIFDSLSFFRPIDPIDCISFDLSLFQENFSTRSQLHGVHGVHGYLGWINSRLGSLCCLHRGASQNRVATCTPEQEQAGQT